MPIKYPDNYPSDWPAIALAVKEAADWQCMACGKQCTRPGEAYTGSRNVLTVAHLDPHSYDRDVACVAALCSVCHLRYDAAFGALFRQRNQRRKQREAGQLTLINIARTA